MTTLSLELVPNELCIRMSNGKWVNLARAGEITRVSVRPAITDDVNDTALTKTKTGETEYDLITFETVLR